MYAQRIGLLGAIGFLVLAIWVVGFFAFGVHDGLFHILFPVGILLLLVQGVRRVAL